MRGKFVRGVAENSAVRVALLATGATWLVVLQVTTRSPERDFFDSPIFWWGWVLFPSLALIGALFGIERHPMVWAGTIVLPAMCWTFVGGTFLHDPDHGASLWLAGEFILLIWGTCIALGAFVGQAFAWLYRRRASGSQDVVDES